MATLKIRNATDDGWIEIGGAMQVTQQDGEPGTTAAGMLWLDTDAEPNPLSSYIPDDVGIEFDAGDNQLELKDNVVIFEHQQSAGTSGGQATSGDWYDCPINTEVHDPNGWGSISTNRMTLAAGTWAIRAYHIFGSVNYGQLRINDITNTAQYYGSKIYHVASYGCWGPALVESVITSSVQFSFDLEYRVSTTLATNGLGAGTDFGNIEVFGAVVCRRIK